MLKRLGILFGEGDSVVSFRVDNVEGSETFGRVVDVRVDLKRSFHDGSAVTEAEAVGVARGEIARLKAELDVLDGELERGEATWRQPGLRGGVKDGGSAPSVAVLSRLGMTDPEPEEEEAGTTEAQRKSEEKQSSTQGREGAEAQGEANSLVRFDGVGGAVVPDVTVGVPGQSPAVPGDGAPAKQGRVRSVTVVYGEASQEFAWDMNLKVRTALEYSAGAFGAPDEPGLTLRKRGGENLDGSLSLVKAGVVSGDVLELVPAG